MIRLRAVSLLLQNMWRMPANERQTERRPATPVRGRQYERKQRLQWFCAAFQNPGTPVTQCFDWSVFEAMTRYCHQHALTSINLA